ncbi:MAG: hypothetical protein AAGD01_14500 [Acidobacteriota bacterium]
MKKIATLLITALVASACGTDNSGHPSHQESAEKELVFYQERLSETAFHRLESLGLNLGQLRPSLREEFESTKALILTNENIQDIWHLAERSDDAEVAILTSDSSLLSNDMLDELESWAASGRGIFVTGPSFEAMWHRFFDERLSYQSHDFRHENYHKTHFSRAVIFSDNVSHIENCYWCSLRDGAITINRPIYPNREALGPGKLIAPNAVEAYFESKNEEFEVIITNDGFSFRDDNHTYWDSLVLFTTTRGESRILWYANSADLEKECTLEADDARLWYNSISWLKNQ